MRRVCWLSLVVLVVGCREKDTTPVDTAVVDSNVDSSIDTGERIDLDGDTYPAAQDCNDHDAEVHPGAEELCDGIDNDCDGSIDEGVPLDAGTWYADSDGDGYGDSDDTVEGCDAPRDYVATDGDCDDTNPSLHPGATENDCSDPTDYNCDGSVGYADVDGDAYPACEDCDDLDADVNEDAQEVCDGVDNDCNGDIDSDAVGAPTWHLDADGDGYGGSRFTEDACTQPSGYVSNTDDCDDLDALSYPGAAEICDDVDNDCDSEVDEGVGSTWYADVDGDGYGDAASTTLSCDAPAGHVANGDDCDDAAASTSPASFEVCDSVDNDCDGNTDESDALDASVFYADSDGDGHGDASLVTSACTQPTDHALTGDDCNDSDAAVSPSATETCDSVDNDCDGETDEDDAADATTWYGDLDADGYGGSWSSTTACAQPGGYVDNADDCDDVDAITHPGALEVCDSRDNNCDGVVDEESNLQPGSGNTWYDDADGDGYGDSASSAVSCVQPPFFVGNSTDCDDTDSAVNPSALETCDTVDNDCDGDIDDADSNLDVSSGVTLYADTDSDGYGDGSSSTTGCSTRSGFVQNSLDCDDTSAAILPESGGGCGLGTDCLDILDSGLSTGDGVYSIDPDGYGAGEAAVDAYCDMTSDGGGWTLASTIPLNTSSCIFTTAGSSDPSTASNSCSKYSDSLINAIARNKIFVARVPGYSPTYTTWADAIRVNANPGLVTQADTLAGVDGVTPLYTPQYGGWLFFHQQNWYNTDRCLGTSAGTSRLSLEYINSSGYLYACSGSCSSACPSGSIFGVTAEVFIR